MPVWHVLVCDTGSNIEHDDTALSVDIVSITETTKLLLTSGIPDIELDLAQVLHFVSMCLSSSSVGKLLRGTYSGEAERVNLHTQRGDILLLKLAGQMALDEGGLDSGVSCDF
jgi:hypothetical protein